MAVAAGFVQLFSEDFHWHVVLGQTTLDTGQIYDTDLHSHTFLGRPMFVSSWLGDVLYGAAYRVGGLIGCYALRAAALAIMAMLLLREAVARRVTAGVAAVLVLTLLSERFMVWFLRPETFAFAMFAAVLACAGTHGRTSDRLALAIPIPLMALWSNTHGSVGVGLLPFGLYCGQRLLVELRGREGERDWRHIAALAVAPLAAFGASALNPEGFGIPLAFKITSPVWTETIGEWLAFDPAEVSTLTLAAGAAVVLLAIAGAVARPRVMVRSLWLIATVAILVTLGLKYRRFITFAEIAAVPLCATSLAAIRDRLARDAADKTWWRPAGTVAALSVALWAVIDPVIAHMARPLVGLGVDENSPALPIRTCRWMGEHTRPGPLFNDYGFGSYLMFCLGPRYPVFIDQRAWSLYSDAFYARYLAAARSADALTALQDEYPSAWAVVHHDAYGFALSIAPERWRLVYFDDTAMVFGRVGDSRATATIAEHEYRLLIPVRLITLPDLTPDQIGLAKEELARAKRNCPGCYRVLLAEAAVAVAARDDAGFVAARDRLLAQRETPAVAYLAGRHALFRNDPAAARSLFVRYRQIGGDELTATVYEARAAAAAGDRAEARRLLDPSRAPPHAKQVYQHVLEQIESAP